jgi:hypothetical protein
MLRIRPSQRDHRSNSHEQCILATVTDVQDLWHRQIVKVNRIDFHSVCCKGEDFMRARSAIASSQREQGTHLS